MSRHSAAKDNSSGGSDNWNSEVSNVPEVEFQPEAETRQEVNKPAEIQGSMSAICEERLRATRPYISDTASQYVTADKPETTTAFITIVWKKTFFSPHPKPPLLTHATFLRHGYINQPVMQLTLHIHNESCNIHEQRQINDIH